MPDDTHTGGQAPTGEQGQAPNAADPNNATSQQQASSTPQVGAGNDQQPSQPAKPSMTLEEAIARIDRMDKELADTRKEAAAHRVKAKQLDDKLKAEADAQLSDIEKAQKRADAAEAREKTSRERIARSELKLAAKEAGIIDPDDAIAFLLGRVEYDDDGEPKDVAQLVEGLKASKGHLFRASGSGQSTSSQSQAREPASSGGATNPARTSGPIVVTADQYLNKDFQRTFRSQHGIDIVAAARQGKVQIV